MSAYMSVSVSCCVCICMSVCHCISVFLWDICVCLCVVRQIQFPGERKLSEDPNLRDKFLAINIIFSFSFKLFTHPP